MTVHPICDRNLNVYFIESFDENFMFTVADIQITFPGTKSVHY